jgi:tetratricopeptide (TPR) repeat protein
VAELCAHLDGIPLALELAAARVRSLSVEQINARLHDRFKLLTSKTRTALPRQQTLRSTLDWSFDLLTEPERAVLRRLTVFAGGFTLEAASAVASDAAIDEFAVTDLLSQLVARSLVVADTKEVSTRYRLLETTRVYAAEKLVEAEEVDAIRRQHAQYFRDRFECASDDWLRMSDMEWRVTYVPELDNVRAALDWALGAGGDPALAVELAGASGPIWMMLSLYGEGVQRLEAVVACAGSDTPDVVEARLRLWLGVRLGDVVPAKAAASLERAIDLYRRLDNGPALGYSLVWLGRVWVCMGRFEQAALVHAEASPLVERVGLPKILAAYFKDFGTLKMMTGDLAGASKHFDKALSLYRGAGAESAALAMLLNLADVTWVLGDLEAALAGFREAVAMLRKSPTSRKSSLGVCLTNLAGVCTERGELDRALAAAREGLPLLQDVGNAWSVLDHLALRAALAGKLANAARLAGYVDLAVVARESPRQPNEARAHQRLQALLREKLSNDEFEQLLAEGAKMTEDEACRLALED